MPYKGEHSCRLEDPGKFDKFNRVDCEQKHEGKCIDVIYGIKDNKSKIQALRYKTDVWDEDDARAHCKEREGMFEAAAPDENKKDIRPSGLEHRTFELDNIEVRADEDDENPKIRGHAAVFEKLSEDLGGFKEKIAAGAFNRTIQKDDIRALFNHDPNYILGRNKAGTLNLDEDEKGLYFEIDPPDTSYSRDLQVSIKRGDISQCSFAFMVDGKKGEEWDNEEGKMPIRTLKALKLYDISPVTYPAYPQTDVKIRTAFAAAGIDYEAVSAVIEKHSRGEELNEEDRTAVREAVDKLSSYLEAEGEEPGGPSSGEVTRDAGRQAMWNWKFLIASIK